jgi:hypothetical protein
MSLHATMSDEFQREAEETYMRHLLVAATTPVVDDTASGLPIKDSFEESFEESLMNITYSDDNLLYRYYNLSYDSLGQDALSKGHRETLRVFLWPDIAATIFIIAACGLGMLFAMYQVCHGHSSI